MPARDSTNTKSEDIIPRNLLPAEVVEQIEGLELQERLDNYDHERTCRDYTREFREHYPGGLIYEFLDGEGDEEKASYDTRVTLEDGREQIVTEMGSNVVGIPLDVMLEDGWTLEKINEQTWLLRIYTLYEQNGEYTDHMLKGVAIIDNDMLIKFCEGRASEVVTQEYIDEYVGFHKLYIGIEWD